MHATRGHKSNICSHHFTLEEEKKPYILPCFMLMSILSRISSPFSTIVFNLQAVIYFIRKFFFPFLPFDLERIFVFHEFNAFAEH